MSKYVEEKKKEFVDEFIKCLDEDIMPWKKGWKMVYHSNVMTKKNYKGFNQLLLMLSCYKNKYTSTKWATFKQVQKINDKLMPKSKATKILFSCYYDKKEKKTISHSDMMHLITNDKRDKEDFYFCPKVYNVFNAQNFEKYKEEKTSNDDINIIANDNNDINIIRNYVEKEKIEILFIGNEACYIPSEHNIYMPMKSQFLNDDEYYSTLLHEIAHSTLNSVERKIPSDIKEKKELYAFEELVAEISSVLLCCEFEINLESIQNNKAYIKGWSNKIKKDSNYLLMAIKNAERICKYISDSERQN